MAFVWHGRSSSLWMNMRSPAAGKGSERGANVWEGVSCEIIAIKEVCAELNSFDL